MKLSGCQWCWGSWCGLGWLGHWRWQSPEQNWGLVLWGGGAEKRCKLNSLHGISSQDFHLAFITSYVLSKSSSTIIHYRLPPRSTLPSLGTTLVQISSLSIWIMTSTQLNMISGFSSPIQLNSNCFRILRVFSLSPLTIWPLLRIYTGGCYYFNKTTEEWEGVGLSVEEGAGS